MSRIEGSVATSLQQLLAQEEERRAEQVLRARHLKQEQERLLFEEQAHRAEEAQRRAEAIAHEVRERSATERATEQRLQCERTAHLERVRAEIELDAKLTVMKAEQQQEVERLALLRDARVRTLEGQRGLLVALLLTLALGMAMIYGAILRPMVQRQALALVDFGQTNEALRRGQSREHEVFLRRVTELSSQLNDKSQLVETLRKELAAAKVPPKKGTPRIQVTSPRPNTVCTCNKTDPLCDCW
jgi:hypothetical protein